jgi:transcription elongation factor GreA
MGEDYIYLSKEGFAKLKAELHHLKAIKRPAMAAEIKRARELGDLAENAEYHAAKEAQTHLERRIAELELGLSRAQVVKDTGGSRDTATLLSSVRIRDLEDGEEIVYHLVSTPEADLAAGKISTDSPVGRALIGHKIGDTVEVATPGGLARYEILEIGTSSEGDPGTL